MHLSVIIVNYNVKYFLEQCLCSVLRAIDGMGDNYDAEVIVFDNASTDGSETFFQQRFPEVRFTWHDTNLGFGKANNKAMEQANGKYILFLNPDTILSEESLVKSVSFLENHPDAGALGIRMIDGAGHFLPESKRGFPSPDASFYKMSGLIKLFPTSKKIAAYYMGHLSQYENNMVDVLSGAYMMVKKEALDKTGGFDEAFFMYGEDIDLSYRIQQAGYQNYYFAEDTIIHYKGESTRQFSARYVKVFYKAMDIFVQKHFTKSSSWWYIVFIKMAIAGSGTISFIKRKLRWTRRKKVAEKLHTVIIGNPDGAREVRDILSLYPTTQRTIRCEKDEHAIINRPQKSIDELIIVTDAISYKTAIALVNHLPKNIAFKIHAPGSKSIIGSDNKQTNGEVLHY